MKKNYFEGWYLKHVKNDKTVAFIPAFHIDESGNKSVSIQMITNDGSYYIPYKEEDFVASKRKFFVRIGDSVFSKYGIKINIQTEDLSIKGKIKYNKWTSLKYNIMGPFALLPFMECNHSILSMYHTITGRLKINNKFYDFNDGIGYIEKDYGTPFPKSYFWTQCSFVDYKPSSVMIYVAEIPFLKKKFMGCIGIVMYLGKEYRFATYLGAKIIHFTEKEVYLKQGKMSIIIDVIRTRESEKGFNLKAPVSGKMERIVNENISCTLRYRFYLENELCFDRISSKASLEIG